MTGNPLEVAIRKVLNDRRIFSMPRELLDKAKWSELRDALQSGDRNRSEAILQTAEEAITTRIDRERDEKTKRYSEEAKVLLVGLKSYVNKDSSLVRNLADQLDAFGPLKSNLPDTEDLGKVVERHGRPTAEQFFLYKIQKERAERTRSALTALFEVVKWLYDQRVGPLEIAFFVRKVGSLTQIVEVLR